MKRSALFSLLVGLLWLAACGAKKEPKSPEQSRAEDSVLSYAKSHYQNVLHKNTRDSIRFSKLKKMEGYRNGQKAPTEYLVYYLADVVDTNLVFDMETGVIKEKQTTRRPDVKIEVWLDSTFKVREYKIPAPVAPAAPSANPQE